MVLQVIFCDHGNKLLHSIKDKDNRLASVSCSGRTVLYTAGDLLFLKFGISILESKCVLIRIVYGFVFD